MFMIALFIITLNWKKSQMSTADEWIDSLWYRKYNEILLSNKIKIKDMRNNWLSKRSQTQIIYVPSYWEFKMANLIYCKKFSGLIRKEAQGNFWTDVYILVGWCLIKTSSILH